MSKKSNAFPNVPTANAGGAPSGRRLVRRGPSPLVLEQRFMFDGAAVADAVHATDAALAKTAADAAPAAVLTSERAASDNTVVPIEAGTRGAEKVVEVLRPVADAREILFIDKSIPDYQTLVKDVRPNVEVVLIDGMTDPWGQISAVLEQSHDLTAVHIVSHGAGGEIIFGGKPYTAADLSAMQTGLAAWHSALAPGADILLYGCNIAAGENGQTLISTLASLTQADVAASSDATGATALGGNWALEADTGKTEATSAFVATVGADYAYNLTAGVFSSTTGTNVDTSGVTTGLIGAGKLITFDSINVTTTDSAVKLIVRAYDVDYGLKNSSGVPYAAGDPASEWDGVYIQKSGDSSWTFVGYLNGTNNNWSYTTFDVSSIVKTTGNYIVRVVPDDNGTQTQASNGGKWVVGTSIAELFLGTGGAYINTLSESGQTVTSQVTPTLSGNYTIQYLLIDSTGRAVAQVDAAANGLVAGTSTTLSSTLAANSNFYSSWSSIPSGSYTLQETLFDSAGVVQDTKQITYALTQSGGSSSTAKINITTLDSASWTGASPADLQHLATTDTTPNVLGTTASVVSTRSSTTITLKEGNTTIGTGTLAKNSTSWNVQLTTALSVGSHTITASYTKSGWGNGSSSTTYTSSPFTIVIDAPTTVTPAITNLTSASWIGSSSADLASQANHSLSPHTTADSTPALVGTAGALATLNVYDGSTLLGYSTADASGNWTFQVPDYLQRSNGTHNFTVKDVGNSKTSSTYALTIDSTAPTQNITINSISNDTGSSNSDFVTSVQSQTIYASLSSALTDGQKLMGSLDGGTTWTDVSSYVSGTAVTWTGQSLNTGYADTSQYVPWSIEFKAVDAGNQSGPVATQNYQVLQSAGVATISTIAQSSASSVTTNYSYPIFTGIADPNTVVDVYAGSTLIGTAAVNSAGQWTLSPTSAFSNATYVIKAVERDPLSGYVAADSTTKSLTINTSLPLLTLNSASDSGLYNNDGITNDDTPSVRVNFASIGVTLTTSDTVEIYKGATKVGTATLTSTNISNKYVDITTSSLGSDGAETLTAKVIHGANTYQSNDFSFTLDRTVPVLASAAIDADTLTLTYTEAVGFNPTAPDLSNYTVKVGGSSVTIDSLDYDPIGHTVKLNLAAPVAATDAVAVTYTNSSGNTLLDLAGNKAAALSNQSVTNNTDVTAPLLSNIALRTPASGPTNATSVTFRVTFSDASGGVLNVDTSDFVATLTGASTGSPTIASVTQVSGLVYDVVINDPALATANGTLALGLATQAQGMDIVDVSASSNALADNTTTKGTVVLDHIAPVAPTLTLAVDTGASNSDKNTASGVLDVGGLEVGATWQYSSDGTTWTTGSGASFTLTEDGAKSVQVRQTDTAGNVSPASSALPFILDTNAPAISSATANGSSLVLTYSDANKLDGLNTASVSAYQVTVGGTAVTVTSMLVDADNKTVTLALATPVAYGQTVTVSYTDPTGGNDANAVQDLAGNDAGSVTDYSVTNNTANLLSAQADTASATEAGGILNGTAGLDPTGNVMANDSASTTIKVTLVQKGGSITIAGSSVAASSTSESNGTSVSGDYGTLVIGADGSYKYSVVNSNAMVQALNVADTLTDTFSYKITDLNGHSTSSTLTVTIHGVNDAPTASDTSFTTARNTAKEGTLPTASDVDSGDSPTYAKATDPAHGTLTVGPNGAYTYTPTADYSGEDSFTYTVSDGHGGTSTYTVNVTVAANVPATFGGTDTASVTEDSGNYTVGGTLTVTDSDSATTVVAQTNVAGTYGTFSIATDGTWSYVADNAKLQPLRTPAQATDSFTVASADGTSHAIVVTLNGVNDAPTASDTSFTTARNTAKEGTLPTASDVDSGDSPTYAKATDPAHGTLTVGPNGAYTYTPTADYSGEDSFTYTVSDGHGGTSTYTVNVTVAANVPATFGGTDTASVTEDSGNYTVGGTLTVTDSDSATTVVAQTNVAGTYGTFSIATDGTWSYVADNAKLQPLRTPAQATDSFTVASADGTSHAIVVTLNGVNDAPTASDTSFTTARNTAKEGTLPTASDVDSGDSPTYAKATDPAHGTLTVGPNGAYTYTPTADYSGEDSFTYTVSDGHGGTSTYTVNVTVAANVPATFGGTDTASVTEDSGSYTVGGTLTVTDSDSATTVVAQTNVAGTYGTFSIATDGTWSYVADNAKLQPLRTPAQATDSFTVASADGTSHAIVVTLNGVNDAPTAAGTSISTLFNTAVDGRLPTASDVDTGDKPIYAAAGGPAHGTLSVNPDGSYTYTPAKDYSGTDSFNYSVSDGHGGSVTYTVSVTVEANRPATFSGSDTASVTEDSGDYVRSGALGVKDVDGPAAIVAQHGVAGAYGTFSIDVAGNWTYVADNAKLKPLSTSAQATDSFTVTSADGTPHMVVITLNGINHGPEAGKLSDGSADPAFNGQYAITTPQDVAKGGAVKAYDPDSGDILSYSIAGQPTHGSVTVDAASGAYVYTPAPSYHGTDSFVVAISDGHGGSTSVTVAVTVQEVQTLTPVVVTPVTPPSVVVAPPVQASPADVPQSKPAFDSALSTTAVVQPVTSVAAPTALPVTTPAVSLPATNSAPIIGDVLTSSSGFRVVVAEAPSANLSVFRGVTDQYVESNRVTSFSLPADAFVHSKADAKITLVAKQSDGSELPSWVQFDSRSGTFQLNAPQDFHGQVEVQVIARDEDGREASAVFRLNVGESRAKAKPTGRPGLSEQIRQATQRSTAWHELTRSPVGRGVAADGRVSAARARS